MNITPITLKKHLGIPHGKYDHYYSSLARVSGHGWIDHVRMGKGKDLGIAWKPDQVFFISEPYAIGLSELTGLLDFVRAYKMEIAIDGCSKHNPGGCSRIVIWKECNAETRTL